MHTSVRLMDGRVLTAGGVTPQGILATAELYDPRTGVWSPTGNMNFARAYHTATLLDNGKVLVVGGVGVGDLASAELYDPAAGTWSVTKSWMRDARHNHTATLLLDGRVLVAGGCRLSDCRALLLNTAEIYDPLTDSWTAGPNMIDERANHTATRLPDGRVLLVDGAPFPTLGWGSSELYDPVTKGPSKNNLPSLEWDLRQIRHHT